MNYILKQMNAAISDLQYGLNVIQYLLSILNEETSRMLVYNFQYRLSTHINLYHPTFYAISISLYIVS